MDPQLNAESEADEADEADSFDEEDPFQELQELQPPGVVGVDVRAPPPVKVLTSDLLGESQGRLDFLGDERKPRRRRRRKRTSPLLECFTVCVTVFGLLTCLLAVLSIVFFAVRVYQQVAEIQRTETAELERLEVLANETDRCLGGGGGGERATEVQETTGNVTERAAPPVVDVNQRVLNKIRQSRYQDCDALLSRHAHSQSGPASIRFKYGLSHVRTRARCDMDAFGGGWTVIQSRGQFENPPDFFSRDFSEYVRGFGDEEGEFWLGLDVIQKLTDLKEQELLMQMWDQRGGMKFARYSYFHLGSSSSSSGEYRLHLGRYTGTAGDYLSYSQREAFSTRDRDNDYNPDLNCAEERTGGWWFRDCAPANLNGLNRGHDVSSPVEEKKTMGWGFLRPVRTEMKIRPRTSMWKARERPRALVEENGVNLMA